MAKKRIELETTIAELKLEKEARVNCDFVKTAQKNAVKDAFQKIESRFAYYDDRDIFSKRFFFDAMGKIFKDYEGTSVDPAQANVEQVKAQTIELCAKIIDDVGAFSPPCYYEIASDHMQEHCQEFCEEYCLKREGAWECWNEYLKTKMKECEK